MTQENKLTERADAMITKDLMDKIKSLAEKEQRKPATMIRILLEYAINEKTRKRNRQSLLNT